MKVTVLYRSNSEQERTVLDFERDFLHQTGQHLELYDLNTRDGWSMAALYDVVQYPAVLAMTVDGQLLQMWQGENMPRINEVSYYTASN